MKQVATPHWKELITDPEEQKVFQALDGFDVTWRTASAVARQTGLSEKRVWEIAVKYHRHLTLLADKLSITGSAFIGLLDRVA